MAIRQRTWERKGQEKSAWVVDYFDIKGKRRLKTFRTKRAALDFAATTRVDIKNGTHIADEQLPHGRPSGRSVAGHMRGGRA